MAGGGDAEWESQTCDMYLSTSCRARWRHGSLNLNLKCTSITQLTSVYSNEKGGLSHVQKRARLHARGRDQQEGE